jgi:ABC-type glycerol-3-phosphate transport system substrate-binding protein
VRRANADNFNLDIVTGNTPDIIYVSGSFPERFYTTKGLLEDLYPYIDADPELSRASFVPGIIEAMDSGGKLYQMPDWFYLSTVAGPKHILGDANSLTFEEYYELIGSTYDGESWSASLPSGAIGLTYMASLQKELINWDTGECHFDTPEFIEMMKFANSASPRGTLSLVQIDIYNLSYIETWRNQSFNGEPMSYVGLPGIDGNGSSLKFTNLISMYSGSEHKDGAWEFIRELLLPDFQLSFTLMLPSNLDAFDTVLEQSLQNEGLDVSVEELDDFRELISGIRTVSRRDEQVIEIINDAAGGYFAGQKSAKETARDIQSRVSIYVSEQRLFERSS